MMYKQFLKSCAASVALALCAVGSGPAAAAEPIKIGYAAWADTLSVTAVAKYVLETKMKQPVQLVKADLGIQFQSVARGDLDLMLCAWLPTTHGAYYEKNKAGLEDLGTVYSGAKIGWAVPTYVPESEVSTIGDLQKPEVKAKLKGIIQGIEPGTGLMRASEKVMDGYELSAAGYKLQSSSEAGMLATLTRSYPSKQWIVATVWNPHWLFQKWNMRYLKDPKGLLGGEEHVNAMGSKQFAKKFPEAYAFVKNFKMDLADVEAIEHAAEGNNDYDTAAKKFVDSHPEKLKAWLAP
jgi:glycine betaine/proline transport system substrate-binding protein